MIEIKQRLKVNNHKVIVNLPKDFHYKQVNVIISPLIENSNKFSFLKDNFEPIQINHDNIGNKILEEERNLI